MLDDRGYFQIANKDDLREAIVMNERTSAIGTAHLPCRLQRGVLR